MAGKQEQLSEKKEQEELKKLQEKIEKEIEVQRNKVLQAITQTENRRNYSGSSIPAKNIFVSIDDERKSIENRGLNQDITLKKTTLIILFAFLAVETIAIFTFSFFQATFFLGFMLEEWSFKLLISATIIQITFMLNIAVKHLFPNKN